MNKCKFKKCGLKHYGLGYCRKHHIRFKRNGTTKSKYDLSANSNIDDIKDTGPGRRGYLAVNVINDIKYKARQRGKIWKLDHKQAFKLISSPCVYCGFRPEWPSNRVGIDRVCNEIGYEFSNCVSCCFTCNSAKNKLSLHEFKIWIQKVYDICFQGK